MMMMMMITFFCFAFFPALSARAYPGQIQGPYGENSAMFSVKLEKIIKGETTFYKRILLSPWRVFLSIISGGHGAGVETVGGKYGEWWPHPPNVVTQNVTEAVTARRCEKTWVRSPCGFCFIFWQERLRFPVIHRSPLHWKVRMERGWRCFRIQTILQLAIILSCHNITTSNAGKCIMFLRWWWLPLYSSAARPWGRRCKNHQQIWWAVRYMLW